MITAVNEKTYEFRGLSSDKKPINKYIGNGSLFIEMDTNKVFMFSKDSNQWFEFKVISSGGGGTTTGEDEVEFATKENFPKVGEENKLYVASDESTIYIYSKASSSYIPLSGATTEDIKVINGGTAAIIYK